MSACRRRPSGRSLGLIPRCPLSRSEMTSRAVLAALPGGTVAPMFFTPDDNFDDLPETAALPDCAVALLARAGSWSARNSQGGFVPAVKLAGFTSDPVQASDALVRCRWWRRARGGFQFTDWPGWLRAAVVTAGEDDAAAIEQRRAADRERQRRRRDREAAASGQPPRRRGRPAKPQVEIPSRDQSRDGITGHVTDLDRSDHLHQSSSAGKSRTDARASAEADEATLVAAVADVICARTGQVVGDDIARAAIAEVRRRARKARTKIHHPLAYIPQAIANEPDLYGGLLLPEPPPLKVILADARDADQPPGYDPKLVHEFDLSTATGSCTKCDHPRSSWRHSQARTA